MKYLTLGIAGVAILGFFYLQTRIDSAYKKGFESGSNKEKSICKDQLLDLADHQTKIYQRNETTIIKSKKIAEDNRHRSRDELIDRL